MSNFLVTGGAGFIGANLVQALCHLGHQVRVIDDLSTGFISNLDPIMNRIDFIKAGISQLSSIKHAFKDMDYVIHLAAWRAVGRSVDNPITAHRVNSTGTVNVLQLAKEANVKKVVFISSSAVYGNAPQGRNKETDKPRPQSPYAVAKLSGEYYCSVFSTLYNLPTVSLRLFNVYGPYSRAEALYSLVIPIFLKKLLQNEPPTIDWHGRQSRDFIHVADVTRAIILASSHPAATKGSVFNIGYGTTTTINDLLSMLQEIIGTSFKPTYGPKREGDTLITFADTTYATKILGFKPTITLSAGLQSSIDWYKQQIKHDIKAQLQKSP
jgi:nucleoside-diphosphate-sugar epimerase